MFTIRKKTSKRSITNKSSPIECGGATTRWKESSMTTHTRPMGCFLWAHTNHIKGRKDGWTGRDQRRLNGRKQRKKQRKSVFLNSSSNKQLKSSSSSTLNTKLTSIINFELAAKKTHTKKKLFVIVRLLRCFPSCSSHSKPLQHRFWGQANKIIDRIVFCCWASALCRWLSHKRSALFLCSSYPRKKAERASGEMGQRGKSGEEKKDIEKEIHYLSITIVDYRRSQRRATVGIAIIVVVDAAATVVIITDGVLGIGDTSIARWRCWCCPTVSIQVFEYGSF